MNASLHRVALVIALLLPVIAQAQNNYLQTNLVSDIPGLAAHTDPNLVNPWGISSSSGSPLWVSDNGRDASTIYNGSGTPAPLVVSIPPGMPTGTVFNGSVGAFNGDFFLFATESGSIAGWRPALGTTAETLVNNGGLGAIYKGIALADTGGQTYAYAADFHNNAISVFKGDVAAPNLTGNFTDPNLPAGYAPFNIQTINGKLFVTYALQDAGGEDDVPGAGHGFLDVFDLNGNFIQRLVSDNQLNSPWGLAIAPAEFGAFSNDLLVGNFGDGRINAFNPITGAFLGTLNDPNGNPLSIEGLWGLRVGNGGNGGDTNSLFFAAGINDERHGLFGRIAVSDSGSTLMLLMTALASIGCIARRWLHPQTT